MIATNSNGWANDYLSPTEHKNQYIQNYIVSATRRLNICPICDMIFADHTALLYHFETEHLEEDSDAIPEEIINELYDPRQTLRRMEVMQRVKDPKLLSIGEFFGKLIINKHNQNVIVTVTGPTGSGKSNASLEICDCFSEYAATALNRPKTDFFNMDNVAVMEMSAIANIIKKIDQKRFNAVILDDAGTAWNARNSSSKDNKSLNKVVTTFRDANILLIINTVSDFMIDKYGRRLTHYTIEMTNNYYDYGIAIGKIKKVQENHQENKLYYKFPTIDGVQYSRIGFKRAPKELADAYEAKRSETRKKMTKASSKSMGPDSSEPKEDPLWKKIVPEVNKIMIDNPGITARKISTITGKHYDTVKRAIGYINGERE